jgi:alpha-methylacyl-CoA racemase
MTGWGQTGPWRQMAGHDIDYIAVTGALHAIGRADGPPQVPLNLLGDFADGSMFLLAGVLAALLERERSGLGQVIDASIVDGTASLTAFVHGVWRDERGVNPLDTGAPYYDVYETADGQWMAVRGLEPAFYAELIRRLEIEEAPPQHDQSRWPELRSALARRFAQRTRDEWVSLFAATDACVAPVLSFTEAAARAQVLPDTRPDLPRRSGGGRTQPGGLRKLGHPGRRRVAAPRRAGGAGTPLIGFEAGLDLAEEQV